MDDELLTTRQAAQRLGIARASLYAWLAQSNAGALVIRGQPVTIDYLQGGPQGQGRIRIAAQEVRRLQDLMRVCPSAPRPRRTPVVRPSFPGITVRLGRPNETL
jgi:hypothetical protein